MHRADRDLAAYVDLAFHQRGEGNRPARLNDELQFGKRKRDRRRNLFGAPSVATVAAS